MSRLSLESSPLCLAQWCLVRGSGWVETSELTFMYGAHHDSKLKCFLSSKTQNLGGTHAVRIKASKKGRQKDEANLKSKAEWIDLE